MEGLELRYLAPYLPYDLYFMEYMPKALNNEAPVEWSKEHHPFRKQLNEVTINGFDYKKSKLILRPMSDFRERIDGVSFSDMISHGYHNIFWTKEKFDVKYLMYHDLELLISRHADVFGLIEKGLAIDINTLSYDRNSSSK